MVVLLFQGRALAPFLPQLLLQQGDLLHLLLALLPFRFHAAVVAARGARRFRLEGADLRDKLLVRRLEHFDHVVLVCDQAAELVEAVVLLHKLLPFRDGVRAEFHNQLMQGREELEGPRRGRAT
jgi:hypothetical protein